MRSTPRISLITPVFDVDPQWLRRCIESVLAQWYPYWELCLCDDASTRPETRRVLEEFRGSDPRIKVIFEEQNRGIAGASNRAAEFASGEFLAMLDNDDELTPDALFEIASAIDAAPDTDVLYSDEDKIDENGRYCEHYFKPDFSPEHLQSVMYMLHLLVIRKKLFLEVGGFRSEFSGAQDFDLVLRATEVTGKVVHVPKVLYHWRKIPGSAAQEVDAKPAALDAGRRALQDFVDRRNLPAQVLPGLLPGLFRVKYRVAGRPKAALVIVASNQQISGGGSRPATFVEQFVRSIVERTLYTNYEIVVAHDGNQLPGTLATLTAMGCRLVKYEKPPGRFNFAHKANWSIRQAGTEHVVLLNDDMEVIRGEWLEALLEHTQQPWIGAAGGKLVYEDGRIQHAGIVLGVHGGAAHVYHGYPADFVGYNAYTHVVRNYSTTTAACMATKMSVFEAVGGFDERFSVDYNDADYCLSLIDRGYRIVYTPYCELRHYEGQSLTRKSQNPTEVELFNKKWRRYLDADPYYNLNLSRHSLDFTEGPGHPRREG